MASEPLNTSNGFDYSMIIFDDSTDNPKPYYSCPACNQILTHEQVRNHKCINPYKLLRRILDKITELNKTAPLPTYVGYSKIIELETQRKLLEELLKE